jgi:hypothetical protein
MSDPRILQARQLADEAAAAASKFTVKSPTGVDSSSLASIALSLSVIADVLSRGSERPS